MTRELEEAFVEQHTVAKKKKERYQKKGGSLRVSGDIPKGKSYHQKEPYLKSLLGDQARKSTGRGGFFLPLGGKGKKVQGVGGGGVIKRQGVKQG